MKNNGNTNEMFNKHIFLPSENRMVFCFVFTK